MQFKFPEYLIKKYSAPFTVLQGSSEGHYDTETGKWIGTSEITQIPAFGCVVPYEKNVVYQSGGSIKTTDRQIITKAVIPFKSTIIYRGEKYKIMNQTDYDEYSCFYTYMARRVDAFD